MLLHGVYVVMKQWDGLKRLYIKILYLVARRLYKQTYGRYAGLRCIFVVYYYTTIIIVVVWQRVSQLRG